MTEKNVSCGIILQKLIFGINDKQLRDISAGQLDGPFTHVNYDLAIRRLRELVASRTMFRLDPKQAEQVGKSIIATEFRLWLRAIEGPDHDDFNGNGIIFTKERDAYLLISVRRYGNRWKEEWTIVGCAPAPTRTAAEIMNSCLTKIERQIIEKHIDDMTIEALAKHGDIVRECTNPCALLPKRNPIDV